MFKTAFNGYAVKFSPFLESRLAVATSQNFGIIGSGRQYVLDLTPNGFVPVCSFDTPDGLYDCTWSEDNENILVSASGDGSVKLWDLAAPPMANPVSNRQEHSHEVASVDWNMVRKDSFLSSSWDDTIRLWTVDSPQSLRAFVEHSYCVYKAVWYG
jgi:peroxin-7